VLVLETNPPAIPPPPPPSSKPKFVQQNYATPQTAQSAVTVSYANTQTPGDANILAIGWNDATQSISTVSDSAGNAYQAVIPTFRGNGMSQAIYFASNIKGGTNAVTVTFDHPAAFVDLRVAEYSGLSGLNAFDAGASATGNSANADSGPVTTGATNELLFGAGMTAGGFSAAGTGFSQRAITSPDGDIIEDQVATVAGVYDATALLGSNTWLMQLAAFRAAVAVTPPGLNLIVTATNTLALAWPTVTVSFHLQENSDLTTTNWLDVTNTPQNSGSNEVVVLPLPAAPRYYRLRYP
jgi:hypothetical protein